MLIDWLIIMRSPRARSGSPGRIMRLISSGPYTLWGSSCSSATWTSKTCFSCSMVWRKMSSPPMRPLPTLSPSLIYCQRILLFPSKAPISILIFISLTWFIRKPTFSSLPPSLSICRSGLSASGTQRILGTPSALFPSLFAIFAGCFVISSWNSSSRIPSLSPMFLASPYLKASHGPKPQFALST